MGHSQFSKLSMRGIVALLFAASSAAQVQNKRPETMTTFTADRILLFVHDATYPAETTFDLQLAGLSWMDYMAQRGYDRTLAQSWTVSSRDAG